MCEYCGNVVNNELLYESETALLEIEDSMLSYFAFGGNKFTTDINYCPMCGRCLKELVSAIPYSPKSLYGRIEDEVNEGVG